MHCYRTLNVGMWCERSQNVYLCGFRLRAHQVLVNGTTKRTPCAVGVGEVLTTYRKASVLSVAIHRRELESVSVFPILCYSTENFVFKNSKIIIAKS